MLLCISLNNQSKGRTNCNWNQVWGYPHISGVILFLMVQIWIEGPHCDSLLTLDFSNLKPQYCGPGLLNCGGATIITEDKMVGHSSD